jgi:hypothetical protein
MPVQSRKNQYLGVNAHLHSFWQGMGKWDRFHNVHVGDIYKTLNEQLRPMGYKAEVEESLQIRRVDETPRRPISDILIRDTSVQRKRQPSMPISSEAQTLALEELIDFPEDWEHPYSAIQILQQSDTPVGWIELLSPSNKGNTFDAAKYNDKRLELIRSGLVFVEVDYLHETPSTFWRLPDYTQKSPDAHAYRIVVLEPRPDFYEGYAYHYPFDVDTQIPKVSISLNAGDVLKFDFGVSYRKTFEEGLYGFEMDYSQLPMNFERYSEADQTRIARRMLAVLEAARDGVNLESAPFPVKEATLQEALAEIDAFKKE